MKKPPPHLNWEIKYMKKIKEVANFQEIINT